MKGAHGSASKTAKCENLYVNCQIFFSKFSHFIVLGRFWGQNEQAY